METEGGWEAPGKMVGKCGPNPWWETHRSRSSDHSGFVLSLKKLLSVTYAVGWSRASSAVGFHGYHCPCFCNMNSLALWLHAGLAWHRHFSCFLCLVCVSDLPNIEWGLRILQHLQFFSSLGFREFTIAAPPPALSCLATDVGEIPQVNLHSPELFSPHKVKSFQDE